MAQGKRVHEMSGRPRDQLRQAFEELRREMRLTMEDVDGEAGLQSGYYAKCICGTRALGGTTLDKVLKALGVKILLVPDDGTEGIQAVARIKSRSDRMKVCGKLRWEKIPKEERSAVARRAVQVRWNKTRRSAAMRSAGTRRKNAAALVIWERLILCGSIAPPVMAHGFFTGPGWAGVTGSMFKRKGRKRAKAL
jgi:hypothetical protein